MKTLKLVGTFCAFVFLGFVFLASCQMPNSSWQNGTDGDLPELADGTTGWVLPTQWQWHSNWFEPPFSTKTDITVTYGETQVAGTVGWF
jgi:hypothetical protein